MSSTGGENEWDDAPSVEASSAADLGLVDAPVVRRPGAGAPVALTRPTVEEGWGTTPVPTGSTPAGAPLPPPGHPSVPPPPRRLTRPGAVAGAGLPQVPVLPSRPDTANRASVPGGTASYPNHPAIVEDPVTAGTGAGVPGAGDDWETPGTPMSDSSPGQVWDQNVDLDTGEILPTPAVTPVDGLEPDDTRDETDLDLEAGDTPADTGGARHRAKGSSTGAGTGKGAGKKKKSHTIGGVRLTARDFRIIAFLGRYRIATVGQLARMFETSETALRNRLPRLERAGLVTWAWAAQTKPKVWLVTDPGLQTVGMHLTAPTVKWGQLRHTLGLVDLGITFESAGEVVLTEREIRAAATRYTPTPRMRSAVDLGAAVGHGIAVTADGIDPGNDASSALVRSTLVVPVPGRGFGHIPDMVLARAPYPNGMSGNIAIELELTRKGLSDWKTILTAYRDSAAFAEVYYFVMSREVQRALTGLIAALGASEKIKVVPFTPVDLTADPYVTGGGY